MSKYTLLKNKSTQERSIRNNRTNVIVTESDSPIEYMQLRKRVLNNLRSASRDACMKDLGLEKVYGAVSGKVYWE